MVVVQTTCSHPGECVMRVHPGFIKCDKQHAGFRSQHPGTMIQNSMHMTSDPGTGIQDRRCKFLNPKWSLQNLGSRTQDPRSWTQDPGSWTLCSDTIILQDFFQCFHLGEKLFFESVASKR